MSAEEVKTPTPPVQTDEASFSGRSPTERVREILKLLAQSVSAMKIFPSNHGTVRRLVDDLTDRFRSFLDEHGAIEIGIHENSFSYAGETVYADEHALRNLPFFFYKDGMQMLFFYPGLDRQEIGEFLEIIRRESFLPPDEADIVNALWEREFGSIQYFAPDDFLENRVLKEREDWVQQMHVIESEGIVLSTVEIKVDNDKLQSGRIELAPEDRVHPQTERTMTEIREVESEASIPADDSGGPSSPLRKTALDEQEIDRIELMIRSNRELPPRLEYIDLLIEILFLEDNLPMFHSTASVLEQHFLDMVQRKEYSQALMLIERVRLLKTHFDESGDAVKAARLAEFLKYTRDEKILEALRSQILEKEVADPKGLMDFLKIFGPSVLQVLAEVYEMIEDLGFRRTVHGYFRASASDDFRTVISLVNEHHPILTRDIIGLLVELKNKKVIPFFANFLNYTNKDLKLDAIDALWTFEDDTANRILLEFLRDADPEIRIRATLRLRYLGDLGKLRQMILLAKSPEFRRKNSIEQKAIFSFLSKTQTEEACEFLRAVVMQPSLFSLKVTHLRLLAVEALASMGTAGARAALERGSRVFSAKVRRACFQALEAPPAPPPPIEGQNQPPQEAGVP